jgi:hypothetical protein
MNAKHLLVLSLLAWMTLPSGQILAEPPQVAFGEKKEILFNQKGKQEVVTVEVERLGYLMVRFDKVSYALNPSAAFWQGENKLQYNPKSPAFRAQPGRYQIAVLDRFNVVSERPFFFWVEFVPEEDPAEPNDTPDTARRVDWEEMVPFWILPTGDRDFFRFEAPEAGYAWMGVSPHPGLDLALTPEWLDEEGKVLTSDRWVRKVPKGPGLLRIKGRYEMLNEESVKPFYASLSFMPETDLSEPNDTLETARAVELGSVIKFQLIPEKDVDFFRFEVKEPGLVYGRFVMAPVESSYDDYKVEILDAQGKPVAGLYSWQQNYYATLDPGTYFLKIHRSRGHTGFESVGFQLAWVDLKVPLEGADFTLIGLGVEKDQAAVKELQMIAQANGGKLVLTSEAQKLKEEFVKAAKKNEPGQGLGWLWLLLAAGALAFWFSKRRGKKGPP